MFSFKKNLLFGTCYDENSTEIILLKFRLTKFKQKHLFFVK